MIDKNLLASVLDEIVPPSGDGRLPGAGHGAVVEAVEKTLQAMPDLHSMITHGLADLSDLARSRHGRDFSALPRADRLQLLSEQGFVMALTLHTYVAYYQSPAVVEALGLDPRPPHPQGYQMEPNDLTLLETVRRRPKMYRNC